MEYKKMSIEIAKCFQSEVDGRCHTWNEGCLIEDVLEFLSNVTVLHPVRTVTAGAYLITFLRR